MSGEGSVKLKNDSPRLKTELAELLKLNKSLYDILFDLADYVKDSFKKELVVTGIFRTDQEQDEIYKNDAKYKIKKFKSPHQNYTAFDLRDSTFIPDEIKNIVKYLNDKYNKTNTYTWTALDHSVGKGYHFHVQFVHKKV